MENENKLNGIPSGTAENETTANLTESENNNTETILENNVLKTETLQEKKTNEPKIVSEISELRGENRKVFLLSDGCYQAVFYTPETADIDENSENGGISVLSADSEAGVNLLRTYSWANGTMSEASLHTIGKDGNGVTNRMYIGVTCPALPNNPRIKKAELKLFQHSCSVQNGGQPKFGLYNAYNGVHAGDYTPILDPRLIDYDIVKTENTDDGEVISYCFDITKILDAQDKAELSSADLVLKMIDEVTCNDSVVFYGGSYGSNTPQLAVTYEAGYAVNTSYRTHIYELGRFGQAAVDLVSGNLMLESEDFAWQGIRMPVTIKHLYNSALTSSQYTANSSVRLNAADFSAMKLGGGFRLNLMQSMVPASFQNGGVPYNGYVFIDENGEETCFKTSEKTTAFNGQEYNLYEDANGGEMKYDPQKKTMSTGEETYYFDEDGRLTKISSGRNSMTIAYTSGRIASVTDGANRVFNFAYNTDGFLTSITAPDGTKVQYTYASNRLSTVTYPNGRKATITYAYGKPSQIVLSENNTDTYKIKFTYQRYRVETVTEYGVANGAFVEGPTAEYTYSAARRNTVMSIYEPGVFESDEAKAESETVYAFDNEGNIVSQYAYSKDMGNVGVSGSGSGIRPHSSDGVISNADNLLLNHNFETLDCWTPMEANAEDTSVSLFVSPPKHGENLLRITSNSEDVSANGVYQQTNVLPKGDYTFSVYAKPGSYSGASETLEGYIRVVSSDGSVLAESEHITGKEFEYIRLSASFTLAADDSVKVQILVDKKGMCCFDAAQLENNPVANAYNLLENGNFENGTEGWNKNNSFSSVASGTAFNMSHSLNISGSLGKETYASQKVSVIRDKTKRETFTLSGWAKGYGIIDRERNGAPSPRFCLRAEIKYRKEAKTESYTAEFSPYTEEWQFASVQFSKKNFADVENITVYCDYSYNSGNAYFDNIQLVRDNLEENLSEGDFPSEGEYATATGGTSNTFDPPAFKELKDSFGNFITETTFTDGEFGTLYRSFDYGTDGNNLVKETDARGGISSYTVDKNTSRNTETTDRLGNKTAFEYDASGRTTKVTSKKTDGTAISNVSYSYDGFDNMTGISRGDGMGYALTYNAFHNLESIGVRGKTDKMVNYDYKNGSGRLKQITYTNGDTMKVIYNAIGQLIDEKWYDSESVLTAHYKYSYDGKGNLAKSLDIFGKTVYTYLYEEDRIVNAYEHSVTLDENGLITSKKAINTIAYYYDGNGTLRQKKVIPYETRYIFPRSVSYEYPENGDPVVSFDSGDYYVTSHSKHDSFGRKIFDELQLQCGTLSRQYTYYKGKATDLHIEEDKMKSRPATRLVKTVTFDDERTLTYSYDAEDRITKIVDSEGGITEYTYDELGQLLSETVDGTAVNSMTYDNYGNIKTKNGVVYTYGDSLWKDLLTKVGDLTITYDKQGNPTDYLGHTLVWEKGRQLKSFDTNSYTYNANGIRTSKTVNGVKHSYVLDGTKILREVYGSNVIAPIYDNEDSICGIYNRTKPYYFIKNLQGDVIGITDERGGLIAEYKYDAWGVPTVVKHAASAAIADLNPFRYRGYYYDTETGLYYLQSRYYDPTIGRFINADEQFGDENFGLNLYAYCYNNAVNYIDDYGYAPSLALLTRMHNAVLASARAFLACFWIFTDSEVRTYNRFGRYNGRMDIYSRLYNRVWEVKRNNTVGRDAGKEQLKRYTSSFIDPRTKKIQPRCGNVPVYGAVVVSGYVVTYFSKKTFPALILYDYMTIQKAAEIVYEYAVEKARQLKAQLARSGRQILDWGNTAIAWINKKVLEAGVNKVRRINAIAKALSYAGMIVLAIVGAILLIAAGAFVLCLL